MRMPLCSHCYVALTLCLPFTTAPGQAVSERSPAGEPVRILQGANADRDAKQPQAAVDSSGNVYVVFGSRNAIRVAVSNDLGRSFQVSEVGSVGALSLGMRRGPRIAVSGNRVVVTAIGGAVGKGRDGDVLAWISENQGKTWTGPVRVNSVESSAREGLHAMASGPEGLVYCTWLDLRNGRMELYGARSIDGGRSWESDKLVYRSPERSICECCHPSVSIAPDGRIFVMWRNQLQGDRDMYLTSSVDKGQSFGPAKKLGMGRWPLAACPMDGGSVAAGSDGRISTVWMRSGSIFATGSGTQEITYGLGVQAWNATGPDGVYAVWLRKRPGALMLAKPGAAKPIELANQANDPMIVSSPGPNPMVVVVWESGSGTDPNLFCQAIVPQTDSPPTR
jgi:hypothetical protein